MDTATRLVKTPKGKEEIEQRRYKLAGKLRTLLILVADDGKRLGAPDDALIVLMRDGFVASLSGIEAANDSRIGDARLQGATPDSPPEDEFSRFRTAKHFMNETAVDNLGGLKKFTFTLKLERCSVRTDLANLLPHYEVAMGNAIGRDAAAVLVSRMRMLLA